MVSKVLKFQKTFYHSDLRENKICEPRDPKSEFCFSDPNERKDWWPHLAMILSNAGSKKKYDGPDLRSFTTLGKGYFLAGQFCYLMANQPFGNYNQKNVKLVLLGADRTLPFEQFATTEAIQMTEIFEYSQKLSNPDFVQPSFLYYKFLYAIRLLDFGFASQALHYLEELAKAVTKHPSDLDPDLAKAMNQVYK